MINSVFSNDENVICSISKSYVNSKLIDKSSFNYREKYRLGSYYLNTSIVTNNQNGIFTEYKMIAYPIDHYSVNNSYVDIHENYTESLDVLGKTLCEMDKCEMWNIQDRRLYMSSFDRHVELSFNNESVIHWNNIASIGYTYIITTKNISGIGVPHFTFTLMFILLLLSVIIITVRICFMDDQIEKRKALFQRPRNNERAGLVQSVNRNHNTREYPNGSNRSISSQLASLQRYSSRSLGDDL